MEKETNITKIVIVGNGLDLHHEQKTSYGHFIEFLKGKLKKPECNIKKNGSSFKMTCESVLYLALDSVNENFTNPTLVGNKSRILNAVIKDLEKKNWADIEQTYFNALKISLSQTNAEHQAKNIAATNKEFLWIKNQLEDYLLNEVESKNTIDTENQRKYEFTPMFNLIGGLNDKQVSEFKDIQVFSFNYTYKILNNIIAGLTNIAQINQPIFIHGTLSNDKNPIIFGYGDENSEEYKKMELAVDNELLKNFKTFQYLRNSNYQKVLALLESNDNIYLQIIGHSCGLCDKALLKKMFEHPNVKKIESVYYKGEEEYFNNLYNISRIFDDNTLMREKVMPMEETRMI